jgi:hypothetical protein
VVKSLSLSEFSQRVEHRNASPRNSAAPQTTDTRA